MLYHPCIMYHVSCSTTLIASTSEAMQPQVRDSAAQRIPAAGSMKQSYSAEGQCLKLWREGREVARRLAGGAHVDGLAVAQDEQLVELAEDLRRRLVDRRDHHTPAGRHLSRAAH